MRGTLGKATFLTVFVLALASFALCAVEAQAAVCPNEALRSELHSGLLPNCRAYELVTPAYKEGAASLPFVVSEDGAHAVVGSLGVFESAEGDGLDPAVEGAAYLLSRTPAGWAASPIEPPESRYQSTGIMLDLNTEFTSSLWALGTLDQPLAVVDLYLRESDGSLVKFVKIGSPTSSTSVPNETEYHYRGASADLSHVLFEPLGGFRWPSDATVGSRPSLYEYVGTDNVAPSLVGVIGEGEKAELVSQCGTGLGSFGLFRARGSMYNAISASGTRIFFAAIGADDEACGGMQPSVDELLMREEASSGQRTTVAISEPLPSSCPGSELPSSQCRDARFEGASRDGSKLFFTSTRALAEGASEDNTGADSASGGCASTTGLGGCNLYEDELNGAGPALRQKLVAVSSGGPHPEVQGVARISEDGSHVYFVAKGVLTGTAENDHGKRAATGADNLYVYESDAQFPTGHTSFIATLGSGDEAVWAKGDSRPVQASADGRFLVFLSRTDITGEGSVEGVEQVYQYDAQTASLVRVSIGQGGYGNDGRSPTYNAALPIGPERPPLPHTYMGVDSPVAASGSLAPSDGAVFFASPTALTPLALNNQIVSAEFPVPNVYEYRDGNVYLISDGRDTSVVHVSPASGLVGASASGSDVFFTTADPLIAQDTDTQQDLYDARVNGGVAVPAVSPDCSEDTCQGPLAAPPMSSIPGSASQAPGGNLTSAPVVAPKTTPKLKTKAKRKVKKRRHKGRKAALRSTSRLGGGRSSESA